MYCGQERLLEVAVGGDRTIGKVSPTVHDGPAQLADEEVGQSLPRIYQGHVYQRERLSGPLPAPTRRLYCEAPVGPT